MKHWQYSPLYLALAAISSSYSATSLAQESAPVHRADNLVLEEVVVTARRREEALQDVPISMTVFNQRQLDDANITNAGDLAAYTPSLNINTRFGQDTTTFAIRGFSQELRTTASVGVYFAEVVAPRGANTSQSGDGAGPGDLFDLQNVQVLKGPQGTLFGRNTTGGAILLTPQRPTDEFEGYFEGSAGNYDMWRAQGVINIPVTDNFRIRLGIDHQQRDGYTDNISDIGPGDFHDLDYTAWRLSAVWDITDSLENYTIIKGAKSENNGFPSSLLACNPEGSFGGLCQADLDERIANGDTDFYDVYNFVPDALSEQDSWQVINTTTWDISDNLVAKNILSYAELETKNRSSIYGLNWRLPDQETGQHFIFQQVGMSNARPITDQKSWVWEAQLQGSGLSEALTWQAGVYYEKSEPIDDYGALSPSFASCDQQSILSPNPADWRCNQMYSGFVGGVNDPPGGVEYTNQAVYAQGTYAFNDQWALTAGLRYTDDETQGHVEQELYKFPTDRDGGYFPIDPSRTFVQTRDPEQQSDEPTWLINLDWTPTADTLFYAKYARGYRQGSVNLAGLEGLNTHGPEEVDSYEIGGKVSFQSVISGTFNVAAFYNDFTDQQIQYGYFDPSGIGNTAVLNAGSSTIQGLEIETVLQLHDNFILRASYAYLDTEVDELELPELPPDVPVGLDTLNTTTAEGEPLSYAPENELVLTGTFLLPTPLEWGDISLSATWLYTDERQAVSQATSPFATLPDYDTWNLNLSWVGMFGSPLDLTVFGTNVTDEEYITFITGNWGPGLEVYQPGVPRMYGARLRYNF